MDRRGWEGDLDRGEGGIQSFRASKVSLNAARMSDLVVCFPLQIISISCCPGTIPGASAIRFHVPKREIEILTPLHTTVSPHQHHPPPNLSLLSSQLSFFVESVNKGEEASAHLFEVDVNHDGQAPPARLSSSQMRPQRASPFLFRFLSPLPVTCRATEEKDPRDPSLGNGHPLKYPTI